MGSRGGMRNRSATPPKRAVDKHGARTAAGLTCGMTNAENAIVVAERVVSDAEAKGDAKLEALAQAQAQTILLKALLVEVADLATKLANRA